jgi:hypothetical protein
VGTVIVSLKFQSAQRALVPSTLEYRVFDSSVTCDPPPCAVERKSKPFSKDKKVSTTLNVIRNGLAHGNIFTFGDPIQAIVFIKKHFNDVGVVRDYSFVFVAPQEFLQFLENWFDFLNDFRIPQEVAFEVLKDAA